MRQDGVKIVRRISGWEIPSDRRAHLRAHSERRRHCRAAEKRDEFAPAHTNSPAEAHPWNIQTIARQDPRRTDNSEQNPSMRSRPAANLTTGALADCDRNPRTLGFRRSEKDEPA